MIVLLQGGYLEGKLRLPKGGEDGLRVVISTRPDRCTMHFFIYLSKVFVNCAKGFRLALPVLLYIVIVKVGRVARKVSKMLNPE